MKIEIEDNIDHQDEVFRIVTDAWKIHPLKPTSSREQFTGNALLVKINKDCNEPEDCFNTHWGNYPQIELQVPSGNPTKIGKYWEYLCHEFTHIIDRHDNIFTGNRTPLELTDAIDDLQHSINRSVRDGFRRFWEIYIDGRLGRKGIKVKNFDERWRDHLGVRHKHGPIKAGELEMAQMIWNSESSTFDELVKIANKYPHERPQKYWVNP